MATKKGRRTYTAKKPRAKRSVSKRKSSKKALPMVAFKQAIGKKFQTQKETTQVVDGKKSKAKGRREGL